LRRNRRRSLLSISRAVIIRIKPPRSRRKTTNANRPSAWSIYTALGFYPVAPGSNEYVIGRPFVNRATLHLPNGKEFRIVAEGLSDGNRYVGRVTLNGQPLTRSFVRQEEILRGGELRFTMSDKPNTGWASRPADRPYSMSPYR
jgi:putative alpha-1,2-mannosidase